MSIESRLLRGDNPEDVAKIFHVSAEDMAAKLKELKIKAPKKAVKKK